MVVDHYFLVVNLTVVHLLDHHQSRKDKCYPAELAKTNILQNCKCNTEELCNGIEKLPFSNRFYMFPLFRTNKKVPFHPKLH